MRRGNVMRTHIKTTSTTKGGFNKEFKTHVDDYEKDVKRIKSLDGKYVMYVYSVTGAIGAGSLSMIVDSAMIDRAVTPVMHMTPAAFKNHILSGNMLPDKKRQLVANFQRERALADAKQLQSSRTPITNRKEFEAVYFEDLQIYRNSKMGRYLNRSTQQALKR